MNTTIIEILACAMLGAWPIAGGAWAGDLDKGIIIRGIGNTKTCRADTVVPDGNRIDGRAENPVLACEAAVSNATASSKI